MKPFPDHIDPSKITAGEFREADPDVLVSSICGRIWQRYMRGETFAILEAHTMAVSNGYTPPAWVLERLNEAFTEYLQTEGDQSLDTVLGLNSPGRGKKAPIKVSNKKRTRHRRSFEIHTLVAHLNIKPEEAAHMVLSREQEGCPDTHQAFPDFYRMWREGLIEKGTADDTPTTASLADDYRKNYRDRWRKPEQFVDLWKVSESYFKRYPEWSWPKKALVKYKRALYTRLVKP